MPRHLTESLPVPSRFIAALFLLVLSLSDLHADSASVNHFERFIGHVRPLSAVPVFGSPDSSAPDEISRQYRLFLDPDKGWLLIGNGNGGVWSLDSAHSWVRHDLTKVFGYMYGAIILPGPCKYGGGGLWRENGMLLKYSWDAREWEVSLISREIPPYDGYCYFDSKNELLYQLGSISEELFLKTPATFTDSLFILDLKSGDWKNGGRFSKAFRSYTPLLGRAWAAPEGILFRLDNGHEGILIDIQKRSFRTVPEEMIVRLWSLDNTSYLKNRTSFAAEYGLYSFNSRTYELIDSVSWEEIRNACGAEQPLIETASSASGNLPIFLFGGIGLLGVVFLIRRNRKSKKVPSDFSEQPVLEVISESDVPADGPLLETIQGSWYLNGQPVLGLNSYEAKLLSVLLEKRRNYQPMSTQQFNEILGIDQRTLDSQKKIRSETIRNINQRFSDLGYRGEAIQRSRQEDDRRAVTYFLAADIRIG